MCKRGSPTLDHSKCRVDSVCPDQMCNICVLETNVIMPTRKPKSYIAIILNIAFVILNAV